MSGKHAAAGETAGIASSSEAARSQSGTLEGVRRVHSRQDIEIEVTLESESNFYMGLTENLSEGGLFIATHILRPLGTSIEVALKLPDVDLPLRVRGTVRWVREYSETSDTGPGLGLRFDDMPPEKAALVRSFLAAREPLFHDDE